MSLKKLLLNYGMKGIISLFISWINTKMYFLNARLIRYPIDIRGKRYIDFGNNLTTGKYCRIEAYPVIDNNKTKLIIFGKNVQINDHVHISAMNEVKIGNNVLMASRIFISDNNHGCYSNGSAQSSPNTPPILRTHSVKFVVIEDNVWIGEGVTILPGVTISKGSIIGANAVVTKDIPPNSIAVGNPAKVIKKYDFEVNEWKSTSKS